jgi:hypothetical protein
VESFRKQIEVHPLAPLAPTEFAAPLPASPTGTSTDTFNIGNGVSQPRIVQKIEPVYS